MRYYFSSDDAVSLVTTPFFQKKGIWQAFTIEKQQQAGRRSEKYEKNYPT